MKKITILIILSLFTSTVFAGFGDTWAFGPWKTGENLADPGTDSIPFWDDSAGIMAWGGASVAPDFYYVSDGGGIGTSPTGPRWIFDSSANTLTGSTAGNATQLVLKADGDITIAKDLIQSADVMYPGKSVIKTIGINGSGADFEFAANVNTAEQNIDLGAILPAGCVVVSVVLECDVTFTDGAPQSLATDVGIASGSAELLASDPTDFDGNTNVTAAAASLVLAHSTAARNVWVNSTPGVNWSTLTGGELSIIIRYDDLGAVRAQKGL